MKKTLGESKEQNLKRLGVILRNIRVSAPMTMRELAVHVEVSHTAISQAEHGILSLPQHRIDKWVESCGLTQKEFERLLGKKSQLINYKNEMLALINTFDGEMLELSYKVLSKFANCSQSSLPAIDSAANQ